MNDANNIHAVSLADLVEDNVAAYRKGPIASANMITGLTKFVVFGQLMKGLVKLGDILVTLFPAPVFLGEFRNAFQIGLGRGL